MKYRSMLILICLLGMTLFLANCRAGTPLPVSGGGAKLPTLTPTAVVLTPTSIPTMPELIKAQGFQESPSYGIQAGTKILGSLVVDKSFVYTNGSEFILIYTVQLPDKTATDTFQAELNKPDSLLSWLAITLKLTTIANRQTLSGLEGIGDKATGVTFDTNFLNAPTKIDMVVFQQKSMGAIVAVLHGNKPPTLSVNEVAKQLEAYTK